MMNQGTANPLSHMKETAFTVHSGDSACHLNEVHVEMQRMLHACMHLQFNSILLILSNPLPLHPHLFPPPHGVFIMSCMAIYTPISHSPSGATYWKFIKSLKLMQFHCKLVIVLPNALGVTSSSVPCPNFVFK